MKNIKIIPILILFILLTGCGSTNNKIIGVIELNKTTRDELNDLNLEMHISFEATITSNEPIIDKM